MEECKPVYMVGVGPELSINQGEGKLLSKADTQQYQSIVGGVMYLAQVSGCDIFYGVKQLARAMSTPSKTPRGQPSIYLGTYIAGSIDLHITYKHGGFKLTSFSGANLGNNPNNGNSTSSYLTMMYNGPVSVKVGTQGLAAQPTMEAELVAAALAMGELGFEETFMCVPIYIDNT